MFRHHEQANLQVSLLILELSFECCVIKYKFAFNVISFISITHNNCDSTKFEAVCSTSLLYLERYNLVCELHKLVVIIADDSLSQNATVFQVN